MFILIACIVIAAALVAWKAQWVNDLFTDAYNLLHEPERMKRSARIAAAVALGVAVVLLFVGGKTAGASVNPEDRSFDVIVFVRLALARVLAVAAVWPLVIFGAYATWHWLDNQIGKRLWIWTNDVSDEIKAAKKRNGATVLAALILALAFLAAGVVR